MKSQALEERATDLYSNRAERGGKGVPSAPPVGKKQILAAALPPLGEQFVLNFWRKGKGFINEGQKKFFHQFFNYKTMKYIVYARKSTESEERQVLSIESQISELREFAAKEKLEIVASFQEAQTAKEPENKSARTIFWKGKRNFFIRFSPRSG